LEEQNYRLNANGSIYDLEVANQSYEKALQYIDDIYQTLDEVNEGGLPPSHIQQTRQSTNQYKALYLRAVSLLTNLNTQANTLAAEGEYITWQIQQYVESKRVEIKKDLTQKTIEKINNGSNIWQYTYVTRLHEKKYLLSPDEIILDDFIRDYAFMMSEWLRLKKMSDQSFELDKLNMFYVSAGKYEQAMLSWVDINQQLVVEVLPRMERLGNDVVVSAIYAARTSLEHMANKRNSIALIVSLVSVVAILLGLFFGIGIARSISSVITSFQEGLLDFFRYLNQEKKMARPIVVEGRDEIAVMAKVVNENILNVQHVLNRKIDYQQALLEWSRVNYQDDSLTIKKATELSARALHVERVSVWLFNDDQTKLSCVNLYLSQLRKHESGLVLNRDDCPKYFQAIQDRDILVIDNARDDVRSCELNEGHFKPFDIYSILTLPIVHDGQPLGIICYEKTGEVRHWESDEQEFARSVVNAISLSLEIKKRRLVQEELSAQKDKLHYYAHYDALTRLPNRVLFDDRLNQAIKQAQRHKTKVAVLFIDLDHFKGVNDSMGHKAGDQLLVEVARRLQGKIRQTDSIARLGGDEFTIILDQISDNDVVVEITQTLLKAMEEPIELFHQPFYITLSVGVAIYPDDGYSSEVLLKNADAAMYQAKDDGRNTYQFYTRLMTEKAFERIVMNASFRNALEKKEFIVHYQPQVDVRTGHFIGMEALVRWIHPDMGLLSPSKFLSFAEDTGLIIPMDHWVMTTAMTQFRIWYEEGLNPGVLALNVSMKQLQKEFFVEGIQQLLNDTGCQPQWIELEVTEGQVMENSDTLIQRLGEIKELGVGLAIDDFGTGYSSLSQLKRLPIDKLKIDQLFIHGLPDDDDDVVIVKTVISLAQNMGLAVIAEGVETEQQKEFLLQHDCYCMQGYLYSLPVPAADLEALLRDRR